MTKEKFMRSLLFVPADSPKKLDKAMASGVDAVIVDLEDSISPERKADARASALAFLQQAQGAANRPRLLVRVNGLETGLTDDDLDAVIPAKPDAIMLPKANGGASVIHLDAKLAVREAVHGLNDNAIGIVAIATETAAALFLAGSYAGASPRLSGLTWGAEDLSAELGAEANRDQDGNFLDPYRLARVLCLAGAASASVQAIDTVYVGFRDKAGLRRETEEARRDGFSGKLAIHPGQVAIINEIFTPTPAAIAHAQRVIAAFAAAPSAGVVGIDGLMYDRPHFLRAQAVLARAKAAGVG
jgi:citrate lyase subunit beta/citryl-CoA lyase